MRQDFYWFVRQLYCERKILCTDWVGIFFVREKYCKNKQASEFSHQSPSATCIIPVAKCCKSCSVYLTKEAIRNQENSAMNLISDTDDSYVVTCSKVQSKPEDCSVRGPVDCDEWLTTWCGLTLGRVLQVQVAAWFALVQVKSERERSMPCGASEEWRDR
jgi:hypothetical protein